MSTSTDSRRALNSLQGRFILASLLCLPLFIFASGLLLERAFKDSLWVSEQEQLQSQLYILLGSAEVAEGQLWLPEQLPEPRYTAIDSGLYATISRASKDTDWQSLWQSPSASMLDHALPNNTTAFKTDQRYMTALAQYFRLTFDVSWQDESGNALALRFDIYHSRATYTQQLKHFRQQLWYGLSFLAMGLLTIQVLIMRWGLSPLKRLVKELKRLPRRNQQQLTGVYPDEITPITDSLNEVLANEQQQRERYKNTLGDLAHSLKTPLAILQGELQQPQHNNALMADQIERMGTIIRHQLQRAVLQTNAKRHSPEAIEPIVKRLCNAMSKVYRDKNINFSIDVDASERYAIESQDLFELLGNLIENACKYGKDQVAISAHRDADNLLITVADNGEGVALKQQHTILQRGARADTVQPGQGIGLAVTTDIVSAYNGSIETCRSPSLGGAQFQVRLPLNR